MAPPTSSSSSSPAAAGQWFYDVFLSFRGLDVRDNFVDHLYAALKRKGIFTYKDDERLKMGSSISPELMKAIEESRFAIIIFSENYAYSPWCLEELEKIMDCMNRVGQRVIPVFYGSVDPSTVRRQTGSFADALAKHEKRYPNKLGSEGKVRRWRDALSQAGGISGVHVKNTGGEAKFMDKLAENILSELGHTNSNIGNHLVGIDYHVDKVKSLMALDSSDVRAVGIWGMAGIGKTTIAQAIFDSIRNQFKGACFLSEVRAVSNKHGLVYLQQKLLSSLLTVDLKDEIIRDVYVGVGWIKSRLHHIKVLVVLDDLDHRDQLNALAGDLDWFGPGSKIIVTTRDRDLLKSLRSSDDTNIYEVPLLSEDEAIELFSWNAFKRGQPTKEYLKLSKDVVSYAGCLPLALKVLGSFLYGRNLIEWRSTWERLKAIPEDDILGKLQISFDGLSDTNQQLFLDIACFFNGMEETYATKILESFGFHPTIGIRLLCEKSVLVVSDNILQMHDLLQQLGWHIVRKAKVLGKYSRLWFHEDVSRVLIENMGTEAVEGLVLDLSIPKEVNINPEAFLNMRQLRYLKVHNAYIPQEIGYLPNDLRWLNWYGYPSTSLPPDFRATKLVGLELSNSRIIQLWKQARTEPLDKLKFIKLCHSRKLVRTPDITWFPNLEELDLEGCTSLVEIHHSTTNHKKLIVLNLKGCKNLKSLPRIIRLESLVVFNLSGCEKLDEFPDFQGDMRHLLELHLEGIAIKEIPSSIERLGYLEVLNLANCRNLTSVDDKICSLISLRLLTLSGCSKLETLPEMLGEIKSLQELRMDGTSIIQPPISISQLEELTVLSFAECKGTDALVAQEHDSALTFRIPQNLVLPSFSGLSSLKELTLSGRNLSDGDIPNDIGSLLSLEKLNLSGNNFVNLPAAISRLSRLWYLQLDDCKRLGELPQLWFPQSTSHNGMAVVRQKLSDRRTGHVSMRGCVRLLDNHAAFETWLFQLLQGSLSDTLMYLPMKEIPEMFSYLGSAGTMISVNLPLHWCTDTFMGIAICCIPLVTTAASYQTLLYGVRTHDMGIDIQPAGIFISGAAPEPLVPDHAFLVYIRSDMLQTAKEMYRDSTHHVRLQFWAGIVPELNLQNIHLLELKEWGVQLVYKEDMETLMRSLQYSSPQSGESQVAIADYSEALEPARDHRQDGNENREAETATNIDILRRILGKPRGQVLLGNLSTKMYLGMRQVPDVFFSYRGSGSQISITLPPQWLDDTFVGFAICFVPLLPNFRGGFLYFNLLNFDGDKSVSGDALHFNLYTEERLPGEHAFFLLVTYNMSIPERMCHDSRHGGQFIAAFSPDDLAYEDRKDVKFLQMKEWGFHLVYEEDLETLNTYFNSQSDDESEGDQTWQANIFQFLKKVTSSCCSFFLFCSPRYEP